MGLLPDDPMAVNKMDINDLQIMGIDQVDPDAVEHL